MHLLQIVMCYMKNVIIYVFMQEQQQTIGFYKFYHLSKKSSISGCRTLCNAMTMNMLHPNRHQMKMLKNK